MSNARNLSDLLKPSTGAIVATAMPTDISIGTDAYTNISSLPLSGNNIGDQAFVQETNRLYIWTGQGWFNIAIINENPTIDSNSYDATYALDSYNGSPTIIQLAATDPEGIPITWTHVASDSAQYFANITNDSSIFTITAKSNDSIWSYDSAGGTFSITFKASDGVNLATAASEFTITFPVPMQPYGWFAGGASPTYVSTVDRIDYANDGVTASVRGPLSLARNYLAATGNAEYGWFGGGYPGPVSTVDRIDYASDAAVASVRGPLSLAKYQLTATGNTNYGWFGGGAPATVSIVDRIDYASDAGVTSVRGPLSLERANLVATGNTNYGWFGGGIASINGAPTNVISIVDRIDYTNDGIVASVRGPLSLARRSLAATGNTDYGWFGAGAFPAPSFSIVDRIDYANDAVTIAVRGPLSLTRQYLAATGNAEYGWFGGGAPGPFSTVDRIDYAADTATASIRGPMSLVRYGLAATGGYPG